MQIAYYVNFGYPDNCRTLQMLEHYIRCGADTFVFDLPDADPFLEKDYVRRNMEHIRQNQGICGVMEGISHFCILHPIAEIFLIVYAASINEVGMDSFASWCRENHITHVGVISTQPETAMKAYLSQYGVICNISAEYGFEKAFEAGIGGEELLTLQFGTQGSAMRDSFAERFQLLRTLAPHNRIFVETGVQTVEDVSLIRKVGADGVIIGSATMELWDDPPALESYLNRIGRV